MRHALAITLATLLFSSPVLAEAPAGREPAKEATAAKHEVTTATRHLVAPPPTGGIARVLGTTNATAAAAAGPVQEVVLTRSTVKEPHPVRPSATQRMLRRMNAERVTLEPELLACANANGTTNATTLTMRLSVAPSGEVEDAELAAGPAVAAPLMACVSSALSTVILGAPGGAGATIALRVTVPAAAKLAGEPSKMVAAAEPARQAPTAGGSR